MPLDVPELSTNNMQLARSFAKVAQIEEKSLTKFDEKSQKINGQLKLVQDLKGRFAKVKEALAPFKTPQDFRDLKGVSSSPNIIEISAIDKTRAPGAFRVSVSHKSPAGARIGSWEKAITKKLFGISKSVAFPIATAK